MSFNQFQALLSARYMLKQRREAMAHRLSDCSLEDALLRLEKRIRQCPQYSEFMAHLVAVRRN